MSIYDSTFNQQTMTTRYGELFALFPSFSAKFLAKRMQTAEKYPKLLGSFVLVQKSGQPGMVKSSSGCGENPWAGLYILERKWKCVSKAWDVWYTVNPRPKSRLCHWLTCGQVGLWVLSLLVLIPMLLIIVDGCWKYLSGMAKVQPGVQMRPAKCFAALELREGSKVFLKAPP